MPVTVKIPAQLRTLTGGEASVTVDPAPTVGGVLERLYGDHPELRNRMMDGAELRRFVNVYVADEDIRFGDGLDTTVEDGAEVTILPAVAGG